MKQLLRIVIAPLLMLFLHMSAEARDLAQSAAELAELGLIEHTIDVDGLTRYFLLMPPAKPEEAAPILIVLHGGTQGMRRMFGSNAGATRHWPKVASAANALLLVPNGSNAETGDTSGNDQNWNDLRVGVKRQTNTDDVAFIAQLIGWAKANYNVDAKRIYVTGASNGGIMTYRLLMDMPNTFAAGAAFVATLPQDATRIHSPESPTPLLVANGTKDPLMPWAGGRIPGGRGKMRSVAQTIDFWLKVNRVDQDAIESRNLPDRDPDDNCRIIERRYPGTEGGADVVALELQGGGHNLPSRLYPLEDRWLVRRLIGPVCSDVEGAELIWAFLSGYRRK